MPIRRLAIGVVLALLVALPATAQDFQKGFDASKRGDYATALREWRPLAEQGNARAQYNLGFMYRKGMGVPMDYAEVVKWFRKAAEQGFAQAQNDLGFMYRKGMGVPVDYAQAVRWYRKAAGQGNAMGQNNLGGMYENGQGVRQNYAQAVRWFRKAAAQGNANAQTNLGFMYRKGKGVPQNKAEAVRWFRKAAVQGHAQAQTNLGFMYENGQGVRQNYAQAVRWFRKAAAQGNANAQTNLGFMYQMGNGVRQNYAEAVRLYRKAAGQGNAMGQNNLGFMYEKGKGVRQNYAQAARWYRKAAKQGHSEAMSNLDIISNPKVKIIRTYGGWAVVREERSKGIVCSTNSLPLSSARKFNLSDLTNESPGIVIGHNPSPGLFNMAGFSFEENLKANSNVKIFVDGTAHQIWLAGKSNVLFSFGEKNIRLIREMMAGTRMKVRYVTRNGTRKFQNYTLLGFSRAYHRAGAECKLAKRHVVKRVPVSRRVAKPASKSSKPRLRGLGSGFFVTSSGEVLTNLHVVDGCKEVKIGKGRVRLIAKDKISDLALLKTAIKPESVPKFRLGRGIRLGEDVVVAGFPLRLLLGSGLSITKGTVSRLKGLGGDRRSIQITAPVQPGNSGGPVLDTSGNIAGVVVSRLDAIKTAKLTGSLPQNINFAVNAATARAFLDSENIAYQLAKSDKPKSTADIAAEARKYTVLVQCWK